MKPMFRRLTRLVNALLLVLVSSTTGQLKAAPAMDPDVKATEIVQSIRSSGLQPEIAAVLELEASTNEDASGDSLASAVITAAEPRSFFGEDGAGGIFYVLGDGRILLIDSEGSAGVVAASFEEFVGVATGLASWRDALKFVGDGDLASARAEWEKSAAKWQIDQQINAPWPYDPGGFSTRTPGEAREAIRKHFNAPLLADPFAVLHKAVHTLNGDVSVTWKGEQLRRFGR